MTIAELGFISESNGLPLTSGQLAKLEEYAALLREKNQMVNLISRKDEENILAKHILHSLTLLLPDVRLAGIDRNARVFDLGTGGGLPGIPIAIARPDIQLTLCDSISKKIAAVSEMGKKLQINIKAVTERAENIAKNDANKNAYDVVVTRAVAPLDELVKWSLGLLKKKGTLLALKGGDIEEEKTKTKKMKPVASVEEALLSLKGYNELAKEKKKIVRVTLV